MLCSIHPAKLADGGICVHVGEGVAWVYFVRSSLKPEFSFEESTVDRA